MDLRKEDLPISGPDPSYGVILAGDIDSAPFNIADHPWRKPNPGTILAAGSRMKLDLAHSWIVGDRAADIATGRAAHLAGGILISPRVDDPKRQAARRFTAPDFIVAISVSLEAAVSLLLAGPPAHPARGAG